MSQTRSKLDRSDHIAIAPAFLALTMWPLTAMATVMSNAAPGSQFNPILRLFTAIVLWSGPCSAVLLTLYMVWIKQFARRWVRIGITWMPFAVTSIVFTIVVAGSEAIYWWDLDDYGGPDQARLVHEIGLGNRVYVQEYIKSGGDIQFVGKRGLTPLYVAIDTGHEDIAEDLLRAGVNINGGCDTDYQHCVPYSLVRLQNYRMLELLVKHGWNANVVVDHKPLLHQAIYLANPRLIDLLIEAGASTSADKDGVFPLEFAVNHSLFAAASALIRYSSDDVIRRALSYLKDNPTKYPVQKVYEAALIKQMEAHLELKAKQSDK